LIISSAHAGTWMRGVLKPPPLAVPTIP